MNTRPGERSNVEDLLREGAWVRALARRLVADDTAADDIVQDTWIAAMRSAPVERERLRPWLARVVRNFATATRRANANQASCALAFLPLTRTPEPVALPPCA